MSEPLNPVKREWLKQLRKEQKISTREIAELLGISFQHYNDIENGRRNASVQLAMEIAEFFDFPLDRLLKDRTIFKKGEN
jgi:putative transcriptional regulator